MIKKNDTLSLTVEALGTDAEGICRWNDFVLFVKNALPGERISARVLQVKKNYGYGKLLSFDVPSSIRAVPPCPHFGQCGGCSCLHMQYAATLSWKRDQVQACFRKIAKIDIDVSPVIGMQDPFHYRNKSATPVATINGKIRTGFYAQRSHRLIPIDHCVIGNEQADKINPIVIQWMEDNHLQPYDEETHTGLIRHVITRTNQDNETMVLLAINAETLPCAEDLFRHLAPYTTSISITPNTRNDNVILGDQYQTLYGKPTLTETLLGYRFKLSPLSFFQVNRLQAEKLYETALSFAGVKRNDVVYDVYCGAGTITCLFARHCKCAIGIEIVPEAIADANENAAMNEIDNTVFHLGAAEKILPTLVQRDKKPDIVIVDPPRKGVEASALDAIVCAKPRSVVYISCYPPSQARDALYLLQHGYRLTRCQPVDMFCWTSGIENVALFERTETGA